MSFSKVSEICFICKEKKGYLLPARLYTGQRHKLGKSLHICKKCNSKLKCDKNVKD